jgi:putative spermidine/putrescine transport system permease protein
MTNPARRQAGVLRLLEFAETIFVSLVLLFLILPLIIIVPLSFSSGSMLIYPMPGFSLRWYDNLLTSPEWRIALQHSLFIAVCTTAVSTVLGTFAAVGLSHSGLRFRTPILAMVMAPIIVPSVVVAVGMFFFYSGIGLTGSFTGIIIAHATLALPFVVITVSSTLEKHDRMLGKAASSLGGAPFYVFRTVTLPLILPGVASGALFAFSVSFDEIVIALFLASSEQRTLPRQLFDNIQYNIDPTLAAAATVMVVSSAILLGAAALLRRTRASD